MKLVDKILTEFTFLFKKWSSMIFSIGNTISKVGRVVPNLNEAKIGLFKLAAGVSIFLPIVRNTLFLFSGSKFKSSRVKFVISPPQRPLSGEIATRRVLFFSDETLM